MAAPGANPFGVAMSNAWEIKIDLGAEWTRLTGLPFVWAFWAGRPGAIDAAGVAALQAA